MDKIMDQDSKFHLPSVAKKKILDQLQAERDNRMIVLRFGLYDEETLDLIKVEKLELEFVGHKIKDIHSVWGDIWSQKPKFDGSYVWHLVNAAYVNNEKVDFSYVLQKGDVLEFVIELPDAVEVQ